MENKRVSWDIQALKQFNKSILYIAEDSIKNAEKVRFAGQGTVSSARIGFGKFVIEIQEVLFDLVMGNKACIYGQHVDHHSRSLGLED